MSEKKRTIHVVRWTTVVAFVLVVVTAVSAAFELSRLEKGVLDVCAIQQDAYVQLVLDQINLKENREEADIISDILGTLDTSDNKYWTFSKERSMLYVKDVIETNRYKGLTLNSYYESSGAQEFLQELRKDRVIHKEIEVNDKAYVASGVVFTYGEEEYRLCLLTNRDVILNSNNYMTAKFEFIVMVGILMVALLAISMIFAMKLEAANKQIRQQEELVRRLQQTIGNLNESLTQKDMYDTRYQLWNRQMYDTVAQKLKKKGISKLVTAHISCDSKESGVAFLEKAYVLLDKNIMRFQWQEKEFKLLFIRYETEAAKKCLEPLLMDGICLSTLEETKL